MIHFKELQSIPIEESNTEQLIELYEDSKRVFKLIDVIDSFNCDVDFKIKMINHYITNDPDIINYFKIKTIYCYDEDDKTKWVYYPLKSVIYMYLYNNPFYNNVQYNKKVFYHLLEKGFPYKFKYQLNGKYYIEDLTERIKHIMSYYKLNNKKEAAEYMQELLDVIENYAHL